MSHAPFIKVILAHTRGAVSTYKPHTTTDPGLGGIREAIITCGQAQDASGTVCHLLRSDLPGEAWTAIERAGAYPELEATLLKVAADLADGHDPHVVVTIAADRSMQDAHLVTDISQLQAELADAQKRSLAVPRILPYQLGGTSEGAFAVIYSPAAGGIKLSSLHPTESEAVLAEQHLRQRGETKTGLLRVTTPVTQLLSVIASRAASKPQDASRAEDTIAPVSARGASSAPAMRTSL